MKKLTLTISALTLLALAAGILWFVRGGDKEGASRELTVKVMEVREDTVVPAQDAVQRKQAASTKESAAGAQNASRNDTADIAEVDTSDWKEYCNPDGFAYKFCLKYPDSMNVRALEDKENYNNKLELRFKPKDRQQQKFTITLSVNGPFSILDDDRNSFDSWRGWAGRPGGAIGPCRWWEKKIGDKHIVFDTCHGYGYGDGFDEEHTSAQLSFPSNDKRFSIELSTMVPSIIFPEYEHILYGMAMTTVWDE